MPKRTVEEVIAHREVLSDILKNSAVVHRAVNDLAKADMVSGDKTLSHENVIELAAIAQALIVFIKADAENWLFDPRLEGK